MSLEAKNNFAKDFEEFLNKEKLMFDKLKLSHDETDK